eukprot:UN02545
MNTPLSIGRRWLANTNHGTVQCNTSRYLHDRNLSKSPYWCDIITSCSGILAWLFVPTSIILVLLSRDAVWFSLLGGLLGLYILFYMWGHVCLTYLCCENFCCSGCCCFKRSGGKRRCDQYCLRTPYNTTIYRTARHGALSGISPFDDGSSKIIDTINHIKKDIPAIQFYIVASHQQSNGDNGSRTVITYSGYHYIPILHAKHVGPSGEDFVRYLKQHLDHHSEAIIQYQPFIYIT